MRKQLSHINARQKPQPFPGKAPTRILISYRNGNKRLKYLGKPNRQVYETLLNDNNHVQENHRLLIIEFDKGGIITYSQTAFNKANQTFTNQKLYDHYHPGLYMAFWPVWLRYKYQIVDKTYKVL